MSEEAEEGSPKHGEVLPPEAEHPQDRDAGLGQTWLAQVNNYTDRPDLLIAEIEKHDPGFVKRMNAAAEKDSGELRRERFKFGKVQAYVSLLVSGIAAIAVLGAVFYAISKDSGFWVLIALAVIYAVSQGGSRGFTRLIEAVSELIGRGKDSDTKD